MILILSNMDFLKKLLRLFLTVYACRRLSKGRGGLSESVN